jgi:cellulose synthase (UDP-forming)
VDDILFYQLPALLAYFIFIRWIAPNKYLPLLSTAVGAFTTFRILPVVIASLVRPFGVPFRVTPKGVESEARFDEFTFGCISFLLAATALGLFINVIPEWAPVGRFEFSAVATYWAVTNVLVLLLAALMCFEAPRSSNGRFIADEPARLLLQPGNLPVRLVAIALDRSTVRVAADGASHIGESAMLEISDVAPIQVEVQSEVRRDDGTRELSLGHACLPSQTREQMIVKLYTGGYSHDIGALKFGRIIGRLWVRAFGAAPHLAAKRRPQSEPIA